MLFLLSSYLVREKIDSILFIPIAQTLWIHLSGIGVICKDAECNEELFWPDTTSFTFEPWIAGIDYHYSYKLALTEQGQIIKVDPLSARGNLCQCSRGEFVSDKYHKLVTDPAAQAA